MNNYYQASFSLQSITGCGKNDTKMICDFLSSSGYRTDAQKKTINQKNWNKNTSSQADVITTKAFP